jgi:hypothetical protein
VGALSLIAVDGAKNVPQGMWRAWTYMADPGTHSEARGTGFQFVSIGIALAGILLMAAILGFVVEAIQAKMDELKLGISRVVESDHSLILGWTHETVLVIEEICIANESEGGGTIVVMADRAKPSMEQELSMQLGGPLAMRQRLRGTKVVLRSGSPVLVQDLAKVSAEKARATLILAAPGDPDVADAHTLRCVLAMQSLNYISGHIVAEMRDLDNEPLVRLVGGDVIETVTSHDVLGRLILMSAREPGLASVYSTVLGFDGDEFYAQAWPAIDGLSYGEVAFRFPNAIPIGVRTPTDELVLNPDCARVFAPGDELIVLAEDNDTYKPCSFPARFGTLRARGRGRFLDESLRSSSARRVECVMRAQARPWSSRRSPSRSTTRRPSPRRRSSAAAGAATSATSSSSSTSRSRRAPSST